MRGVTVVGSLAVVAAIAFVSGHQTSSPTTGSALDLRTSEPAAGARPGEGRVALGGAHGAVPDGTTVFDDSAPAVARLDPDLRHALRRAATDARHEGIEFLVDSGWRSPEYQERLLMQAITKYGSRAKATRWVAPAATSAHVSGDAVDIGGDAREWLSRHGSAYGLCQIYRNEPWHFELRPEAIDQGCPRMYADPSRDPRMQQ